MFLLPKLQNVLHRTFLITAFGIEGEVFDLGMLVCVRHRPQHERDDLHSSLLEALKNSLDNLNNLRLIPPNDPHVLGLKRHLRDKIAELEDDESYERGL